MGDKMGWCKQGVCEAARRMDPWRSREKEDEAERLISVFVSECIHCGTFYSFIFLTRQELICK